MLTWLSSIRFSEIWIPARQTENLSYVFPCRIMFDSYFGVNSCVLREEIASRKCINEQANLAHDFKNPRTWPGSTRGRKYQRGSLQWISKYKEPNKSVLLPNSYW